MSNEKDQTRLISQRGRRAAASFQGDLNALIDGLLKLQIKAFEHGDLEYAEDIARLMEHPQRLAEKLDLWAADDVKALFERIEESK